ncbi:hypothetical protein LAZ67_6003099 [Cordylochernes scorpioides]|uniref:Mariner Mos1 transposase n=1 Tax=Cordylochernes scorpioides TaxID=51811 RepID=A0ABY6KLA4_9ARAC|nr:hypothetical protein LAZ67_6003099 [Cordylochernes scorpioides]
MYSVGRRTKRWPLCLFFNFLDVVAINSAVIYKAVKQDGGMARKDFIKQLALQLMRDALNMRNQAKNLSRDLQVLIQKHAGTSSLEVMGMVQKQGNWVPYELKPGNIERRICTCELLLKRQNRKGFLHRIVMGDESGFTTTTQSAENRGHDNTWPHVAKVVKETLEALQWDVLPHPPYSPDIAPSDYHMFRSMTHGLAEQHFTSYEEAKNWVDVWIASKDKFFSTRTPYAA